MPRAPAGRTENGSKPTKLKGEAKILLHAVRGAVAQPACLLVAKPSGYK